MSGQAILRQGLCDCNGGGGGSGCLPLTGGTLTGDLAVTGGGITSVADVASSDGSLNEVIAAEAAHEAATATSATPPHGASSSSTASTIVARDSQGRIFSATTDAASSTCLVNKGWLATQIEPKATKICGYVAANGVSSGVTGGANVARTTTGTYTITHPAGLTNPVCVACPAGAAGALVSVDGAGPFTVYTRDAASNALADAPFTFIIM